MGAGVTAPVLSDGTNNFTLGISQRAGSTSTWGFSGIKNSDSQVNSSGNVGPTRTYDAFGNVVSSNGTWQGPFGYGGDYGYQSDDASGLKLLGHRYYDSSIGRFLTRDPIKDGRNWYGYCENNPIKAVDPTGLGWHDPMVISVDPGFQGVVIVVGEPYPDAEFHWAWVPAGYHSHPGMDVDYVLIVKPSGEKQLHFPIGNGTPINPDNSSQHAFITKDGTMIGGSDIYYVGWYWARKGLLEGMKRKVPKDRIPAPGLFQEFPDPKPVKGPPGQLPIGQPDPSYGVGHWH